jgi:CRISPR/Cas system CMR subunit Cmr6 (Cas7 group RAMP superfamily)
MTDTNETNDNKKNFTENITEAINKIKQASEDSKKRFEEIKAEASKNSEEEANNFKVATQLIAEQTAAAAAQAKAAFENAGGIEGISQSAVEGAAKLSANAKTFQEQVANSNTFKTAVGTAKSGASKVASTDFFKNLSDHAAKLKATAEETYKATYEDLHKEKPDAKPATPDLTSTDSE